MNFKRRTKNGFTLIETMVAIALLMLALIAPMSLATQSLAAAYYARNQITAFYLAQEGIEVVRSVRDGNIIATASGQSGVDVFTGIPLNAPFTVNSLTPTSQALIICGSNNGVPQCPPLQTNGSVYAYSPNCSSDGTKWLTLDCGTSQGWSDSSFTRTVNAHLINNNPDEMRVNVTITWQQGSFKTSTFSIYEDLYRWVSSS